MGISLSAKKDVRVRVVRKGRESVSRRAKV